MATEEINYRVDVQRPGGDWRPWSQADALATAKKRQLAALGLRSDMVRDARIVEVRRTWTETVLGVAAASLDILSREEL